MPARDQVHATAVALPGAAGGWHGVALCGPAGAGKSDLALRLIDAGGRLVADDRVDLTAAAGAVLMAPPPAIAGRLEVRGLGIVRLPALAPVALRLIVDLVDRDAVARMPEAASRAVLGRAIPVCALDPFAASAVAKVRLAVAGATRDSRAATGASADE